MRGKLFAFLEYGTREQALLKSIVEVLLLFVIGIGVPLVKIVFPPHFLFWSDHFFLILQALFFYLSFLFSVAFYNFCRDELFVHVTDKERLEHDAKVVFALFSFFAFLLYGGVALTNWPRYVKNPKLFETTPLNHPKYGTLFSFGYYGWVILITFAMIGAINTVPMQQILLIFLLFRRGETPVTTANSRTWESWLAVFGLVLFWTAIFVIPFSSAYNPLLSFEFLILLIFLIVFYLIGRWEIHQFHYKRPLPTSLDELQKDKMRVYMYAQRQRILKNLIGSMMASTAVFIIVQYSEKLENLFNNYVFFAAVVLSVIGVPVVDYLTVGFYEPTVSEEFLLSERLLLTMNRERQEGDCEEKALPLESEQIEEVDELSDDEIQQVLRINMSMIFVLKELAENSTPMSINQLMENFPNTRGNLRSTLNKMIEYGYCRKLKNPMDMRKKLYEITDEGKKLFNNSLAIINRIYGQED